MIINIKSYMSKDNLLSAKWEPNDVTYFSIKEKPRDFETKAGPSLVDITDQYVAYCHYSSQYVYSSDDTDASDLFNMIINLAALQKYMTMVEDNSFFLRKINFYRESLSEKRHTSIKISYPDGTVSEFLINDLLQGDSCSELF